MSSLAKRRLELLKEHPGGANGIQLLPGAAELAPSDPTAEAIGEMYAAVRFVVPSIASLRDGKRREPDLAWMVLMPLLPGTLYLVSLDS